MPRVGFDTTIPMFRTSKIFRALDCAATVIGRFVCTIHNYLTKPHLTQYNLTDDMEKETSGQRPNGSLFLVGTAHILCAKYVHLKKRCADQTSVVSNLLKGRSHDLDASHILRMWQRAGRGFPIMGGPGVAGRGCSTALASAELLRNSELSIQSCQ